MSTKNTRATPDPDVFRAAAEAPSRGPARGASRQASTGANVAGGDAEAALLVGAP
ncbi:MAG: hypothetical protein HOW97_27615 [Catenulispora sp.]|nr:hypothetical protein [Catenulispora sp.]